MARRDVRPAGERYKLPVDFPYWGFALLIAANGDRQRAVRLAELRLDHEQRAGPAPGAASGMRSTFQPSGTALSIGIFTSLMIAGLASTLPRTLAGGLHRAGVPADDLNRAWAARYRAERDG